MTNFGYLLCQSVESRENVLIHKEKEKERDWKAITEQFNIQGEGLLKDSRQKSACANCVHGTLFNDGGYCYLRKVLFSSGAEICLDQKTKSVFLSEGGSGRNFKKARWEK